MFGSPKMIHAIRPPPHSGYVRGFREAVTMGYDPGAESSNGLLGGRHGHTARRPVKTASGPPARLVVAIRLHSSHS